MAGYTHTTYLAARQQLALRLGDSGNVYWSDAELGEYIKEALYTWAAITGYWRDSGLLSTVANTAFYDITAIQNTGGENLLAYTITDSMIVKDMQYALLEPALGTSWPSTDQFTLADATNALQRRRDAFLLETGLRLTHTDGLVMAAGTSMYDFAETVLAIKRLAWKGASTGNIYSLVEEDIGTQRNYNSSYLLDQGIPESYSSATVKPLRALIAPKPNEPGTLDLFSLSSGAVLNPAAGVLVGIPDNFAWVLKWGALADLLGRDGPGRDMPRAYFCERRYRLGVELAKLTGVVMNIEVNGIAGTPESLHNMDRYDTTWQSTTGTPEIAMTYANFIGLSPVPDGVHSVLLDVTRNAVVPSLNGDYIQVGKEYLNVILDYAQHLASFKMGGMEFRSTYRAAQNFFTAALDYNDRLIATNPGLQNMVRQSFADVAENATTGTAATEMLRDALTNDGNVQ